MFNAELLTLKALSPKASQLILILIVPTILGMTLLTSCDKDNDNDKYNYSNCDCSSNANCSRNCKDCTCSDVKVGKLNPGGMLTY